METLLKEAVCTLARCAVVWEAGVYCRKDPRFVMMLTTVSIIAFRCGEQH